MTQRDHCVLCGYRCPADEALACIPVPCHVRSFLGESFRVWRCPDCQAIHCLEMVDLDRYYAKYPVHRGKITWPLRMAYGNLRRRFLQHGLAPKHKFLDYGCGHGHFVKSLRRHGIPQAYGFDPYGQRDGFGNPRILDQGPFDFILLQDVIEHVEDPPALLEQLDSCLVPGGRILIGTPNAGAIDLTRPLDFLDEIHVPYHLHILDKTGLEALGRRQGWTSVEFFNRPHYDLPLFGLSWRAFKEYRRLMGGAVDVLLEPVHYGKALRSVRFWFYGLFGYWFSDRPQMAVMFRKGTDSLARAA